MATWSLDAENESAGYATSLATSSQLLRAGNNQSLMFIRFGSNSVTVSSITDTQSGTWAQVVAPSTTSGAVGGAIWQRTGGTEANGIPTVNFSSSVYQPVIALVSGTPTGGGNLGVVGGLDSPGTYRSGVSSATIDCSARTGSNDVLAMFCAQIGMVSFNAPSAPWNELVDNIVGTGGGGLAVQDAVGGNDTATFTASSGTFYGIGVGVEVEEVGGGGGLSIPVAMHHYTKNLG